MTLSKYTRLPNQWTDFTTSHNQLPNIWKDTNEYQSVNEKTLIKELEQAIQNNEFVNYYQPKIDLKTQQVAGAEALVRWKHPVRGIIPPGGFIPMLERTGLIQIVGAQVLARTIKDWQQWLEEGTIPPQISVNVTAKQIADPNFFSIIEQAINQSGLKYLNPLAIELTESSLLMAKEKNTDLLQSIRALGVPIALDDFGIGYSSLSYLVTLPIDAIKIDRSFVMKMTKLPEFMGLVSTIISLAHNLGFSVVAEGVETAEEANLLRLLRCEQAQGFLYSKPLPADSFAGFLRDWSHPVSK